MLEEYFKDILKTFRSGDATEGSFYSDLKKLTEKFAKSKKISLNITTQPKRITAGAPDFVIRRGKELVGYIEAKDIGKDLEIFEYTPQIERYKKDFDNFILTNYFDFWLWRKKEKKWVMKVSISKGPTVALKVNQIPPLINEKDFLNLLSAFLSFNIPERKTAKLLAQELAIKARLIPQYIIDELNNDIETEIDRIYSAFKKFLITDLLKQDFADIYAQTITYGLFMARLQHKGKGFNRFLAQQYLPKTIKILRDTFSLISGPNLPDSLNWIVDDIATILAYADIEKIKKELHYKTGGDDPLIHFYETFLKEYNPKEKKHRGIYYTPLPIVSYITRSINILLKEKFNKKQGFASKKVTLLDPASGTLTFPANAIKIAKEEIEKGPNAGSWLQIIRNHILKDFYAFELLMAPYVIGHLKISLLLENLGYKLEDSDEIKLYLTNTLDLSEPRVQDLPAPGLVYSLTEEAKKAKEVKEKIPILVVMGNPPYSVSSSNIIKEKSDFKRLYESYKEKVRTEEKNIQPLSDDYIKFIAFAHWKVRQAGQGIVGMITNNSYLDGLIHRDMRRKLTEDFDEIYILNLHGNSKRKEKVPKEVQGKLKIDEKDENVFDIQQGVGIILLIKTGKKQRPLIKSTDLWGLRGKVGEKDTKYDFLATHDIKNTEWQDLELKEPHYFFVPKDFRLEGKYNRFISLQNIFGYFQAGATTGQDKLFVDINYQSLENRILQIFNKSIDNEELKLFFKLTSQAGRKLLENRDKVKFDSSLLKPYSYRAFDTRYFYSENKFLWRSVEKLQQQFQVENTALVTTKSLSTNLFLHAFLTRNIGDYSFISDKTREVNYYFPLYLYKSHKKFIFKGQKHLDIKGSQKELDEQNRNKKPNIKDKIVKSLSKVYKKQITPEEIFYYIYSILYSNIYRKKYNEFLKIDFPKIPFTKDNKLFFKVAEVGKELVDLHLLKSNKLEKPIAKFPISTGNILTDNKVKKREYNSKEKRIYINDKQYFEDIEPEIWDYFIGGYQVLDKWLKDRIGRTLSPEDVNHYLKVITAIKYTIDLQKEIDKIYPEIEKNLIG